VKRGAPSAPSWRGDLLAVAILVAALWLLRVEVVRELGIDARTALSLGLAWGCGYDVLLAALPFVAGRVFQALTGLPSALGFGLAALPLWLASAANVVYFRYFGERLDFWVVQNHVGDLIAVRGALGPLLTAPVAASLALAAAGALAFALRRGVRIRRQMPSALRRRAELWIAASVLVLFVFALVGANSAHPRLGSVLNDQIVFVWLKTGFGTRRITYPQEVKPEAARMISDLRSWDGSARATLAGFRDLAGPLPDRRALPGESNPMVAEFAAEPEATRALRARLGLDPARRPHVILLFLESVRDFEIQHETLGPQLFPALREVLAKHSIHFRQAYSSAIGAGLTARGQFSTMCSLLDNMNGAAAFVSHYRMRAHCLQALARDDGYRTLWISSQDRTFQGKEIFERLHGTQQFWDEEYWKATGLPKNFDNCGVADGPFLKSYLAMLEQLDASDERPFLVNTLTISTHPPHTVVAEGALPPELAAAVGDGGYAGYLSRLRYLDRALGDFFAAYLASPLSERSVVVLLGDHSMKVEPHLPLAPHQRVELLARVPLAIVARGVAPEVIDRPVHQLDVAPTVAALAGLSGPTSWLGRSLFGASGTPWVMRIAGAGLQYRVGSRACYSAVEAERPFCLDAAASDPLLHAALPPLAEEPELSARMAEVVEASSQVIMLDRLLERAGSRTLAGSR
jgi:phosphoglycerol transferase MdoB-like AlkP superfamily enzyme